MACFVILYSYGDGFHVALQTAFRAVGQDLVLMFGGQTSNAGRRRARRPPNPLRAFRRGGHPRDRAHGGRHLAGDA